MMYRIYLIRDTAVDAFLVPMFFQSEGHARRAFADEVNRNAADNLLFNHPEHIQLYFCGTFDDSVGRVEWVPPVFVVDAVSVKE